MIKKVTNFGLFLGGKESSDEEEGFVLRRSKDFEGEKPALSTKRRISRGVEEELALSLA